MMRKNDGIDITLALKTKTPLVDGEETQGTDTFGPFGPTLKQGQTMLRGTLLADQGKEICGAYYTSVRRLD